MIENVSRPRNGDKSPEEADTDPSGEKFLKLSRVTEVAEPSIADVMDELAGIGEQHRRALPEKALDPLAQKMRDRLLTASPEEKERFKQKWFKPSPA